jgi:hypothetical protein
MRGSAFIKTHGKHGYQGKYNSRGQRGISKLYKGLSIDDVALKKAFDAVEKERLVKHG